MSKIKRLLVAMVSLVALVAGPLLLAQPAAASHNYDVRVQERCGLAGGAGDFITDVYMDFSASHASTRVDKLRIQNTTNRTVQVDVLMDLQGDPFNRRSYTFAPKTSLYFEMSHSEWVHKDGLPRITFTGVASNGTVRHVYDLRWYPSATCSTWAT